MPFVRFSRDKRGYEYVYLIDAPVGRSGSRSRVLYWYRTPPGVKVGREPFDAPVRAALEAQNPDVAFDWKKILEAQAPAPPEVEHWRERRRAERSAKMARAARREEPGANAVDETDSLPEDQTEETTVEAATTLTSGFEVAPAAGPDGRDGAVTSSPEAPRGRRRRRGGRRRRNSAQRQAAPAVASDSLEPPSGPPSAEGNGVEDETDAPIRPS